MARRRKPAASKQTLITDICHRSMINAAIIFHYWLCEMPRPNVLEPPLKPEPLAYQLSALYQHYRDHGRPEIKRVATGRPACTKGGSCLDSRTGRGACSWSEHLGLVGQHFRVDVIRRNLLK